MRPAPAPRLIGASDEIAPTDAASRAIRQVTENPVLGEPRSFGWLLSDWDYFRVADIHVSHLSSGGTGVLGALVRARKPTVLGCSARKGASRRRFLHSAEPDIHLLPQAPKSRHRRLSLCSLPVPKQFVESLRSVISFAQSATCRIWQSALCSSRFIWKQFYAAPVRRSSPDMKSRCCRSTASRYETIFRATASVARFPLPFCSLCHRSQLIRDSVSAPASQLLLAHAGCACALFRQWHAHHLVRGTSFVSAESAVADRVLDCAEA